MPMTVTSEEYLICQVGSELMPVVLRTTTKIKKGCLGKVMFCTWYWQFRKQWSYATANRVAYYGDIQDYLGKDITWSRKFWSLMEPPGSSST